MIWKGAPFSEAMRQAFFRVCIPSVKDLEERPSAPTRTIHYSERRGRV
jgi:hypothetical protein